MTTRIACPYCNTSFSPDAVLPGHRLECPRCGETFTLKGEMNPAEANGVAPPFERQALFNRRDKWRVTTLLLLAMALLVIGAGVYLVLFKIRKSTPTPEPENAGTVTRPVDLHGLAYLPADCNLVFGLQPAPLIDYATRTNQDARQVLAQAGLPAGVFAFLDRAGLSLDQVYQVVGGSYIGDAQVELRFALVLVLRTAPADEEQFLRAFEAKRSATGNGRYNVNLNLGFAVPLSMVKVSPTTWVFGWSDADFAPAEQGKGGGLSPGLREMLQTDFLNGSAIWFAADNGKWAEKPLVKLAAQLSANKDALPALAKGQAALGGLSFGDEPKAHILIRCADDATAAKLRDTLKTKAIAGSETGGSGSTAMFVAPFDPRVGLQPLKQFLDAAK